LAFWARDSIVRVTSKIPAGRTLTFAVLALLAVGIGIAYWPSFPIGFVFDDSYGIANNPVIRSLRNIPSFFTDPYAVWTDPTQVDLRPFLLISYAVNYAISGLQPWSYHALNLVLHLIASVLVFFIVRDHLWWPVAERGPQGEARIPAAAAALFFALAPLNSQPVIYVWARSALLCVTLYLGAFPAFLRRRWVVGCVLFAFALLTKAIAITLPAVLLIHDFIYRDRARYATLKEYVADWRRLAPPLLLTGGLALAYVAYRTAVLPPWTGEARKAYWVTPWIWFVSQWWALVYYVRLFLWPDALSIDHDLPITASPLVFRAWASLLALLAWVGLALAALRRYPQVTFATAWFFVTLSPESSFFPLAEVVNDHRPYIASVGLAVLLAWLLYQAAGRLAGQWRQAVFVGACLLLCVPAAAFDHHRSWIWQDGLRLWEDTVRTSGNNTRAWVNAGRELMARGDLVKARRYFERARELGPSYIFVYMNLSVLHAHEGRLDEALEAAQRAVSLRPDDPRTHSNLGRVLERMGRLEEAIAAHQRAVDLNPRDAVAVATVARLSKPGAARDAALDEAMMRSGLDALYKQGDPGGAAAQFRKVLERNPTHYGATFQLATALDRAGKPAEARPLWETVLRMAEGYKDQPTADTARARLQKRP
jgi:protein O-mannosyl-transferase